MDSFEKPSQFDFGILDPLSLTGKYLTQPIASPELGGELGSHFLPARDSRQAFETGIGMQRAAEALKDAARLLLNPNTDTHMRASNGQPIKSFAFSASGFCIGAFSGLGAVLLIANEPAISPFALLVGGLGGKTFGDALAARFVEARIPDELISPAVEAVLVAKEDPELETTKELCPNSPITSLFSFALERYQKDELVSGELLSNEKVLLLEQASQLVELQEAGFLVTTGRKRGDAEFMDNNEVKAQLQFIEARNELLKECAEYVTNPGTFPPKHAEQHVKELLQAVELIYPNLID